MAARRTVIEGWAVAILTVIIAIIFVVASKQWDKPPPRFADPSTYPHRVVTHHA